MTAPFLAAVVVARLCGTGDTSGKGLGQGRQAGGATTRARGGRSRGLDEKLQHLTGLPVVDLGGHQRTLKLINLKPCARKRKNRARGAMQLNDVLSLNRGGVEFSRAEGGVAAIVADGIVVFFGALVVIDLGRGMTGTDGDKCDAANDYHEQEGAS